MNRDQIRTAVVEALAEVAPEIDSGDLQGGTRLREDLDLDSLDFLDVVAAVCNATGVEIPERDYGRLTTLDAFVEYVDRAG